VSPGQWTCDRCGVRVHYLPGFEPPSSLPHGWVEVEGDGAEGGSAGAEGRAGAERTAAAELRCLTCRRDQVQADAYAAAAGQGKREQAKAARAALAELNASLPPTSQAKQRKARHRRSKNPGAFGRALTELRRDPNRPNAAVADAAGVGEKTVLRARKRLRAGAQ